MWTPMPWPRSVFCPICTKIGDLQRRRPWLRRRFRPVGDVPIECEVLNLSEGGCQGAALRAGCRVRAADHDGQAYGDFRCRLVWQHDADFGVAFADPPRLIIDILGDALQRVRAGLDGPRCRSDPV